MRGHVPTLVAFPYVFAGFVGLAGLTGLAGCKGTVGDESAAPFKGLGSGGTSSSQNAGSSGHVDGGVVDAGPDLDPGRVTLHRLNRVEYANTVHDLLGTTARPADDFPPDDRGYGYDNIADVLSLSPVQVEMYWNAAGTLIDEAMTVVRVGARRYEAEAMTASTGSVYNSSAWNLYSAGSLTQTVPIDTKGKYKLSVRAFGQQAGPDPVQMTIDVNAAAATMVNVEALEAAPMIYTTEVTLDAGNAILGASFINDYYDEASAADRNLIVDYLEVEGPLGVASSNPLRARIMTCEPDATKPETCLREVATGFGKRVYRRPLAKTEVDGLVKLATTAIAAGDDVETATRSMLQAMLISPQFLFRVELDMQPAATDAHTLSDYELASRLSFFLWSSTPDDELLKAADAGTLHEDATMRAQITRMLKDMRSQALLDNFAGQWLFIRAIDDHDVDPQYFPMFDAELRGAMRDETQAFVKGFMFGDAPMNELLTANYSFINDRLADHYGLPKPGGSALKRVSLGDQREGLLTQAGVLMVTSYATRTSPVKRGKWVLEQLMCSPPPPPPPGIEGLVKEDVPTGSIRQRMEAHRKNPVCSSCHTQMDPIGFGFEHYDGVGQYRTDDNGFAIDASGMLPDGTTFSGPLELAGLLSDDPRLSHCMAQQLFTYALGRGPESYDAQDLDSVTSSFVAGGYRFRDLIDAIVTSDAFRMRRGEPAMPSTSQAGDKP